MVPADIPFFLSDVVVFEEARTAQVLVCASEETVIEWNHSGEDGYAVNSFTGDVCGGVGMFIVTSLITKMAEGETEFMASLKTPSCEGQPKYSPVESEVSNCTCPQRLHGERNIIGFRYSCKSTCNMSYRTHFFLANLTSS